MITEKVIIQKIVFFIKNASFLIHSSLELFCTQSWYTEVICLKHFITAVLNKQTNNKKLIFSTSFFTPLPCSFQ